MSILILVRRDAVAILKLMSMFSDLMGRIFGKKEANPAVGEETAPTPAPEPGAAAAPAAISIVDVEANLAAMAKENSEELDWKRSIVDLMKLVGMDSSYGARKELALELGYSQANIDSKGSAEMNMWLHKEVMKQLAANGGKVPADLLD